MKFIIISALFFAAALAAPADRDAVIVRDEKDNIGVDGYRYVYETSDGKVAQEEGQLTNPGSEAEAIVVRGQYSYTAPDGQQYTVTYTADANGYHPQGAHLPVGP